MFHEVGLSALPIKKIQHLILPNRLYCLQEQGFPNGRIGILCCMFPIFLKQHPADGSEAVGFQLIKGSCT